MVKKHLGPDEVEILKDKVRPEDVVEDDDEDEPDIDDDEVEIDEDRDTNEIAAAFQRWGVDPDEYFERA